MLRSLRRRIDSLSSRLSDNNAIFNSKLTSNKENNILGIVENINTDMDYISIYVFEQDATIEIPNQYELGLKKYDLVVLIKAEGVYHILGKTNIEKKKDEQYVFDIKTGKLSTEKVKDKNKFAKEFHFKNIEAGQILKHVSLTGYRIAEKFIDIFSGLSRITITFSDILLKSFTITHKLQKNKSFKIFKENDDNKAYDIHYIINENNDKIFLEIKGDIQAAFSDLKIKLEQPPFNFDNAIYLKMILNKKTDFIKKNEISHSYIKRKNIFTGSGDAKINKNVYDKVNNFAKSENLFKKNVICKIDKESFFIKLMEINTFDGEVRLFTNKKKEINLKEYFLYTDNYKKITDNCLHIWETANEEYNAPYDNYGYKITKIYTNEEKHNLSLLLNKRWSKYIERNIMADIKYEDCKDCDLRCVKYESVPKYYFNSSQISYQLGVYKKDNTLPSINIEMKSNSSDTNYNFSVDNGFFMKGRINGENYTFIINGNVFGTNNIKNIYFQKSNLIYAKKAKFIIDNIFSDSLYVKKDFYLTGDSNCIIQSKTFYMGSQQAVFNGESLTFVASDSLTLYVNSKVNNMKTKSTAAILMTPSSITTTANISVPGYCKCSSK